MNMTEGNTALRVCRTQTPAPRTTKRSGSRPQPGNRSRTFAHRKKHNVILYRFVKFCKTWRRLILLVAIVALAMATIVHGITGHAGSEPEAEAANIEATAEVTDITTAVSTFVDEDGNVLDVEAMTDAWAAEAGMTKRYTLTDAERLEVAQVIMAEAEGEPFAGKVAVAQCILQACEDDDLRPAEVLEFYQYSGRRPDPSDECYAAVQAVFNFGFVATSEPIKYFYAPNVTTSEWHESLVYVMTINNHRFFKEADQ